jgi:hypothetical protein
MPRELSDKIERSVPGAQMFKLLIDTCVWLDLAKDPRQHPAVGVVGGSFRLGEGERAWVPQPRKIPELAMVRAQRVTRKP